MIIVPHSINYSFIFCRDNSMASMARHLQTKLDHCIHGLLETKSDNAIWASIASTRRQDQISKLSVIIFCHPLRFVIAWDSHKELYDALPLIQINFSVSSPSENHVCKNVLNVTMRGTKRCSLSLCGELSSLTILLDRRKVNSLEILLITHCLMLHLFFRDNNTNHVICFHGVVDPLSVLIAWADIPGHIPFQPLILYIGSIGSSI